MTLVVVADIARADVEAFQRYEAEVLALLHRHNGRLERRLRSPDETFECHIVSFPTQKDFDSYLGDAERQTARRILGGADVRQRVVPVVAVSSSPAT